MQRMTEKKKNMMQLILHNDIILPNDIIIEILSWLPARSLLLRFRWTSKYWFDLITNSDSFIKMHLHRSSTTTFPSVLRFCYLNTVGYPSKKLSLDYYYYLNNYNDDITTGRVVTSEVNECTAPECIERILGSSNGLILFHIKSSCKCNPCRHDESVCVLNPCTTEYRVLPCPLPIVQVDNKRMWITQVNYGFCYDQTIDDYKVIRIFRYYVDNIKDALLCIDIQVYRLCTNSWRRITDILKACWHISRHGVFLNGALYWMDTFGEKIVSFDIGKEKFQDVLKIPCNLPSRTLYYWQNLQVFEGFLCLVLTIKDGLKALNDEIWVMKDYIMNNNNNESELWTKLLTIPHLDHFPTKLLRYTRNGEILMLNKYKDLVLYDPKNTSYQTLGKICEDRENFLYVEVYTESLVSLNSGTYMDQQ